MLIVNYAICNTVDHMKRRRAEVEKRLVSANKTLEELHSKCPLHDIGFFETQWERQKRLQSEAISERAQERRARLEVLLELEEELLAAR